MAIEDRRSREQGRVLEAVGPTGHGPCAFGRNGWKCGWGPGEGTSQQMGPEKPVRLVRLHG